ncbi:transmembrane protease serine 9 [Solenopsis invicta]|uniref:transmembrane protease serine 9 n=1 Tax=Solenopsis invicta TaxID=13686 RepID=UPI00193E5113|nr:transmembrane protease serine 9 [Solenopsis invicta]
MFLKAVVFSVLFAMAVAERPRVGLRMPPVFPPFPGKFRPHLPQVVGGEEAPVGSYPHIASLQLFGSHFCAGSILNERWIVTAGHCVQAVPSADLITVKVGKHDTSIRESSEQAVDVKQGIVHEQYQGGVGPYDIALLELASPIKLNDRVQPIALPEAESDPANGSEGWLCGWGSTSTTNWPVYPDKLQHVQVEYVDRPTCHDAVERLTGSSPVHETNVCTGPMTGGISACSGDSGGPLITRDGQKAVLTGIVSWGIVPCGSKGAPSVYTRVSKFNDWIAQKTGNYYTQQNEYKMPICWKLSNIEMVPKAIVLFALLAVAIAERPKVGLRLPSFFTPGRSISPQIFGGEPAPEGAYPFIVSLQVYGQHFCAGSILNKYWILTAGHCVQAVPSADMITVKAGKHNIFSSEASEQSIEASQGIVHENFGGNVGPYDIALLKLQSALEFTDRIQPIELAPAESEPTGEAWLCGWGSTENADTPKVLQHVKMEYVDRQTCHDAIERLTGDSPVHETNVCTGPMYDGISACSGDSGGPLFSRNGNTAIQTGIVSWGIFPCATDGAPSVFTKVSKFNDWIKQQFNTYS